MDSHSPQPGDVIVHRQVHSPAVYILSRLDDRPQFYCKAYIDAVAKASSFAANAHVDAWYTTDEQSFERIAEHRALTRDPI